MVIPRILFGVLILAHAGCKTSSVTPANSNAPSIVSPSESLAIARQYTNHSWRPFSKNILHGKDSSGVVVHTPDASFKDQSDRPGWWMPGETNSGIPYKWGGFDSPESFNTGIANGLAGGDVSSEAKRAANDAGVSSHAVGVDCSGFVSRCLKLPSVHDTTQLPSVCDPINPKDLRPGDILNIPRGHVLLCAGWAGSSAFDKISAGRKWIYYYDTGGAPEYWKPSLKQSSLASLLELGYQPLRYRGMIRTSRVDGKQVLSRSAISSATVVENPTIGEP